MVKNPKFIQKTVYFRTQEDADLFAAIPNKTSWLHDMLHLKSKLPDLYPDPYPKTPEEAKAAEDSSSKSTEPRVEPMGSEDWPA
jgi:hypothetical protein